MVLSNWKSKGEVREIRNVLNKKIKEFNFKPLVLAEQISRTLSDAILDGTLKGGEQLTETELQRHFGVSKSPIREALRDLEKKGLVVIKPRKGTFVKTVTRKDIEEIFPVRSVLEGLAAREAYHKISEEDLDEMKQTVRRMEKAARNNDARAYWEYHNFFHKIFINASGNEMLINMLETLRMHAIWYRFSYQYYKEDFHKSLAIHKKIWNHFKKKDLDEKKIENIVGKHVEDGLGRFLDYLEEQNNLGEGD